MNGGFKMNHLYREGFNIEFFERGDVKEPPIFIIGSSLYYPRLFADPIYEKFNFIFLDHRGFLQPEGTNRYSLDAIVEDIEAVREHYGFEKIYLLGHSGHGFMAMRYAELYSNHVSGLILSNLAPTNNTERQEGSIAYFEQHASDDRKTFFQKEIAKLAGDLEKDPEHRFTHMNIRMQAHSFYDFTYDGAHLWKDVYNNMEALDYLWGTAFADFDTEKFIKQFKQPILLLLSDYDFLVAPTTLWEPIIANKLESIRLYKFQQSAHNPMLEQPDEYAQRLDEFTRMG